MSVEVIAVLKPNKGKENRIQELLGATAKIVEAQEKGTLRYQLHKQTSGDPANFVVIESYGSIDALKAHGKFPEFKDMGRKFAKEQLLRSPMEVYILKPVAGFGTRSKL